MSQVDSTVALAEPPRWEECLQELAALPRLEPGARAQAVVRLARNPSPFIRQRVLGMGAALLPEDLLVEFLRNGEDDVLRNLGLETLKRRGPAAVPRVLPLLQDPDDDVALQAILVLDPLRAAAAREPLRALLRHPNLNVVQSAIQALGHLGGPELLPDLRPFLDGEPWVQLAALQALGDLHAPDAVPLLAPFLSHEFLAPAAEGAVARLGCPQAFLALAAHWLSRPDRHAQACTLEHLADLAVTLQPRLPAVPRLVPALVDGLRGTVPAVQVAAARLLLSLGRETAPAVDHLVHALPGADLPACLRGTPAELDALMRNRATPLPWVLALAGAHPRSVRPQHLLGLLQHPDIPLHLGSLVPLLQRTLPADVVQALLDLFLRLPHADRAVLAPALPRHRAVLSRLLEARADLDAVTRVVLQGLTQPVRAHLVGALEALPAPALGDALAQLACRPLLLRRIPWKQRVRQDPGTWAPLAARALPREELECLGPALRDALALAPVPEVVHALGTLQDAGSIPALAALAERAPPLLQAHVLDALGNIGGPAAAAVLRPRLQDAEAAGRRAAYRALARCAAREDLALFQAGARHTDWMVRLSCVEVLARFPVEESIQALALLCSDPMPLVAQRAQQALTP